MCVAGGKRCEVSDALSNVRRKARNKARKNPNYQGMPDYQEREVEEEVKQFLRDNPELAKAHLPERETFQKPAPKWSVPKSLLDMLGDKKAPITGITANNAEKFYTELNERREKLREIVGDRIDGDLINYTQNGYESVNPFLRKKGYKQWEKMHANLTRKWDKDFDYVRDMVKPRIASLDAGLAASPKPDEPEKLYRYYEVPPGVTPEQYAKKFFIPGESMQDKGFISTSADPEFVATNAITHSETKKNTRYVMLEILSKDGTAMQNQPYATPGDIQSLEAEVLLPRNKKLRVIDQGKRTITLARDRKDLEWYAKRYGKKELDLSEGKKISMPVIRMIDEDLIRETRNREKNS